MKIMPPKSKKLSFKKQRNTFIVSTKTPLKICLNILFPCPSLRYDLSEYIPMTQSGPQWHEAWLWSSEDFVTTIQCGVLGPAQPARTPLAPLLAAVSNDLEHWLPVLALTGAGCCRLHQASSHYQPQAVAATFIPFIYIVLYRTSDLFI